MISKAIRFKLLIVLVVITSAWLFIESDKITEDISQVGFFNSDERSVEKGLNSKVLRLPDPGTYKLHRIFRSPDYDVLDSNGNLMPLSEYTHGKITLLTFFYDRCSDADGCPYVMSLFHMLKNKLEKNINTPKDYRFVHISFDPERDTPMMMAGIEKRNLQLHANNANVEWKFLTTESIDKLIPIIDSFGQNVDININSLNGEETLNYSHVLKIFLIDEVGYVREIYSTPYVSLEMLMNDIETLSLQNE